ncbi:ABC transporter permease [Spirochaetia bacterium]|nr:ABC transporter permease [Spirochaetia bacterium]
MVERVSPLRKIFIVCNTIILVILVVACFLPLLNLAAKSLSNSAAVSANLVLFTPRGFNVESYILIMNNARFQRAFLIGVSRTIIGTAINMVLVTLTAYVLSQEASSLKGRNFLMWFFIVPMLFSGGLIPTYLVIKNVGLMDSFWSLVIPTAVQIPNVILMMNFFRNLPKSLSEAAMLDGASHVRILLQIYIPISLASIATIVLFSMVFHWNSWFDGMIYIKMPENQPLQTYIHNIATIGLNIRKLIADGNFRALEAASNE